ncbi:MAG: sigma-70 family RNA polymerase sigma factor, partial [Planctomycetota bacterium]
LVWRKIDRFKGEAPFEGWVYQFCLLEMKSFMRRKIQQDSRREQLDSLDQGRRAHTGSNPDRYEDIYSGLNEIDAEQSQIIRLKHFNQLTFDEISHRLGVSSNTVKTRYYRGLIRLRAHLDPLRLEEGT